MIEIGVGAIRMALGNSSRIGTSPATGSGAMHGIVTMTMMGMMMARRAMAAGDGNRLVRMAGDECRRHSMETYPTTQEPNSEGQQDGSDVAPVEPSEERSESATGSGKVREPKTGKEVVPGWDGSTPIRDLQA